MTDPVANAPLEPVLPPKRGVTWLAWLVIIAVVLTEVFLPGLLRRFRPTPARTAAQEHVAGLLADVQVRYLVGAAQLTGAGKAMFLQSVSLNTGPVDQRLRYIVLAGELAGPDEALKQIDQLDQLVAEEHIPITPEQRELLSVLTRVYQDQRDGTDSVSDADREQLRRRLGWTGELALTPTDSPDPEARARVIRPARRMATTLLVVVGGAALLGLVGLTWFIVWAVFFFLGRMPRSLPPPTRHGGIYAEGFAVYMLVFLGLQVVHRLVSVPGPELLLSAAAMLLSLAAGLFWPVLRGVPWRQVRQEVGLTLGRRPWLEPAVGLAGYAFVLPVFAIGVIVSSVLIQIDHNWQVGDRPERHFAPVEQPSHPIVEWLQNPDWRLLAQVVLIASLLAPLVEETMFRGVLYRHLRNATANLGRVWSFLVSAIVVSFIFAVIHPQGVLASAGAHGAGVRPQLPARMARLALALDDGPRYSQRPDDLPTGASTAKLSSVNRLPGRRWA